MRWPEPTIMPHTLNAANRASLWSVALVGNPNCGKTALFNLLTGARQKVANYAGVTVERKVGILRQHSTDVGRDPAEIEISVGVNGSPDELGPTLRSLGVSLFTVGVGGPDYDLSRLRDWIAWRNAQNS